MLAQRVILITGVADHRSLAAAVARACAAAGAELVCTWQGPRQAAAVRELLAEIQPAALDLQLDVRDAPGVQRCLAAVAERHGRIDGLLHAIAYARLHEAPSLAAADASIWHEALELSARSLDMVVAAARDLLGAGSQILTLTYEGARRVHPGYDLMGVAKAALEAAVRYHAVALGPRGIRVNALSAGSVRTLAARGVPGARERRERAERIAPLGRGVRAEEVGSAAVFLLSPAAAGITGQILHVDNGVSLLGA